MSRIYFFNAAAKDWDTKFSPDPQKLSYIASFLKPTSGQRILDLGTGTGIMVPFIRREAGPKAQIIGIDFAENMIKQAEAKYGDNQTKFICADVTELDPEKFIADGILCYSLYPHIQDKASFITNLARLLNPNGRLVIAHSSGREKINEIHKSIGGVIAEDLLPPISETVELMQTAHLQVIHSLDNQDYYLAVGIKSIS